MEYIAFMSFLYLIPVTYACKTPEWRNMTFEELMFESDVVVYGKDTDHGKFRLPTFTDARFEVYCVFKKGFNTVPGSVIIENIFDGDECSGVKGQTVEGQEYILGLQRETSGFMSYADINSLQKTAFLPTQENFNTLASTCGLDEWSPPSTGDQTKCPLAEKPRWCTKLGNPNAGGSSVFQGSYLLFSGILFLHMVTWC